MRIGLIGGSLACLLAGAAAAQSAIEVSRAVYVERTAKTADGDIVRAIEPAQNLRRGDRVVLVVEWQAGDSRRNFTVASAVPRKLAFQRSSEDEVEISADGGRNWGQLGTLRVKDDDGARLASPEDATHLRWQIPVSKTAQGRGRIAYSAIVR